MALTDPGGMTTNYNPRPGTGQPTIGEQRFIWNDEAGKPVLSTWNGSGWIPEGQAPPPKEQPTKQPSGRTGSTSMGSASSSGVERPAQLVEIPGRGWVWVDSYGRTVSDAGIASQEPFGGYTATQTPTGTLIWDPKTGATGAFYPDEPDPVATPKYIGQSNGQIIIQNPDGSFSFQPIPSAPGSTALKPASASYSYNGPTARPRASTASASTYDAMKAQQAQLAAQAAEAEKQRAFTGGQNTIDRNLQVYRDAAGQRFTGGENAIDRNMNNAQFGANFGLNREGLDLQRRQFGLQGAETFGRLVSSPDLGALQGFMEAGGGNVINAIAGGNDMITPNSVLPGALALQQLRKPFNELPEYNYTPETNPNIPAAVPMPALAEGGYTTAPMFLKDDHPMGIPTGREKVVSNPYRLPIQIDPVDDPFSQDEPMRVLPRFGTGTGRAIMDGTPLSPGSNMVNFTDGTSGWVTVGADGSIVDESGAPVSMGGNTVQPRGGTVDPTAPSSLPPPPGVAPAAMPRGYTMVDEKDIPADRRGPAGTVWTYAHNPTTGKVVRIDAKTGQQFGMYSTVNPPTAEKTTGGYNTPGPRSVTGAVRNAISRANTVGGNAVGVNQAALNRGVFGPNPYGFQYNPSSLSGGSRPSAFRPPATSPTAPTTGTPPGTVDTPAGSVNTNTGNVSQNPPATPAETAQADNSIEQNMRTVEDFRRSFQPAVPWNPMKADYWEQSPDLREISEFGQQTKFGTPVRTLQNDAQRFRLPGVSRSNLALGV